MRLTTYGKGEVSIFFFFFFFFFFFYFILCVCGVGGGGTSLVGQLDWHWYGVRDYNQLKYKFIRYLA